MIDSLYHSSRGGVKTLVDYKINYEKALLFIKKDLNRPNGSVQIYRNGLVFVRQRKINHFSFCNATT